MNERRHHNCRFTVSEEQKVVSRYEEGGSMKTLAADLNCSVGAVRNLLLAYDVRLRTRSQVMIGKQNARRHTVAEDALDRIDDEATAYLLGLLFSDGWILAKANGIGFSSTDRWLTEFVRNALGSSAPIGETDPPKGRRQFAVYICSRRLATMAIERGCTQHKSLTLEFPKIRKGLRHHFIRGLWDGDGGCCSTETASPQVYFNGTRSVLVGVREHFAGMSRVKISPHSSIFRLTWSGSNNALRLRRLLFKNAILALPRKRELLFSVRPRYTAPPDAARMLRLIDKHPHWPMKEISQ